MSQSMRPYTQSWRAFGTLQTGVCVGGGLGPEGHTKHLYGWVGGWVGQGLGDTSTGQPACLPQPPPACQLTYPYILLLHRLPITRSCLCPSREECPLHFHLPPTLTPTPSSQTLTPAPAPSLPL